jgi:outer membrane protein assembly factor BamB
MPIDQPELADRIANAPRLNLEDAGPPPERCWVGHRPYLVPNPDGASWDMIYPYYNQYGGAQEMVIHDFGSGRTRKQTLSGGRGNSILTRERIDFHMQPSYYTDKKLVIPMVGRVLFVIYDPARNAFVDAVKPFGDEVIHGRCVLADDGRIHGIGWPKDKSGLFAYSFDPKTLRTTLSEKLEVANPNRRELYGEIRLYNDWIYAAFGAEPWHLVAYHLRNGEWRRLATTEPIIGDHNTIRIERMQGGLSGHIHQPGSIAGLEDFDKEKFEFWLHEGEIVPRRNEIPPWSDRPAKRYTGARFDWDREYQVWPADFEPPSPPPQIASDAGSPDAEGRVELPYRTEGQQGHSTVSYTVKLYPGEVKLLREVNDHVLFATDSGYGQHVFYDLSNQELKRIGGTVSPYSLGFSGGRLYVSGYPNSQIVEYDFTRKLGLRQEVPNPRRLGAPMSDTHAPLAGTVSGADGRVYNAGTTYGRRRIGGGLGWYDTTTEELGGLPIDGHRIFWMTSASKSRYLVLSSKCAEKGRLFVWDTQTHDFRHRVDPPRGATRPGPIVESLPGRIMGHTVGADQTPFLYGFDPTSGEILWTKEVPSPPITAYSRVRRQAYSFRRGPDGFLWSFFDDALVKIDPRNAKVTVIGRLPEGVKPAQLAFARDQIFLAGGSRLRRVALP